MSTIPPEFTRPERIDAIGETERSIAVAANPEECAALAARFDLETIERLGAQIRLRRAADDVVFASGTVEAAVVQRCVATGEPLHAKLDVPFVLRFVPEAFEESEAEKELSDEDCDTIVYRDGAIDLGEATAETMALALDPFPRSPDADMALRAAGILREDEAGPFAALAGLRDKLER